MERGDNGINTATFCRFRLVKVVVRVESPRHQSRSVLSEDLTVWASSSLRACSISFYCKVSYGNGPLMARFKLPPFEQNPVWNLKS